MAKAEGLWNLFLPAVSGLSQVDYALIAEETGKCFFAPDVFNCQAPGYYTSFSLYFEQGFKSLYYKEVFPIRSHSITNLSIILQLL